MSKQTQGNNRNGNFSSSIGFVLACVGSAVGLGNIWLFPYRLGQYGGAAFLIPYILFVLLFGYVGLSGEFAIGRKAKTGTLGSFELCWKDRKFGKYVGKLGWIPLMGSLGIATGYAIILGWVLRSLLGTMNGDIFNMASSEYFAMAAGDFGSVPYHILIIFIAAMFLLIGAVSGIEKVNKVLMPVFFILFAIIAIRVSFLPGAIEGYKFLFVPKWECLLDIETWIMAMGQAFFTLSITGSGMIVYGSYLDKREDILKASIKTTIFDTMAAMLSALVIMPAVFAFGIEPTAGPSLMFITIPEILGKIPFGNLIGILFFTSVLFAGITSLMNMFEAVIESTQFKFNINRKVAVVACAVICFGIGVFFENEINVGRLMDFVSIIIVPFGALFGAISIYYALGKGKIEEELSQGSNSTISSIFSIVARDIYVPLTVIIFILGIIYNGIG